MSRPPKHRWPQLVAAYVTFAGLLVLAATPVYSLVEAPSRPVVVRLASAVFVGLALMHVTRTLRSRVDESRAPARPPAAEPAPESHLHRDFRTLYDEVRFAARDQRYFEHGLWPRLCALAVCAGAKPPAKPAGRWPGRGPSLATLNRLLGAIEDET